MFNLVLTMFYRVLLCFTGFLTFFQSFTGFSLVLLGFPRFH